MSKHVPTSRGSVSGPQMAAINKFSRRPSGPRRSSSSARMSLPVPGPLNLQDMAGLAIFHLFRKPLTVRPIVKLGVYLVAISVGSLFFDLVRPPPSAFFSNKRNFINQWFVRYGWGWTFWPLLLYVGLSSAVYCNARPLTMIRHVSRLLVATGLWWVGTSAFNWLENRTGLCRYPGGQHPAAGLSKPACLARGGIFAGFDVSGHIYMLVLCNLVVLEEVGVVCRWGRLRELLFQQESGLDAVPDPSGATRSAACQESRQRYEQFTPWIKALAVFLSALSVVWDLMIIMTTIYFHKLPSKVMSVMCVAVVWLLTYHLWYPLASRWPCGPPSPGQAIALNFL